MNKVLVTGGCGYIGSHTVCSLITNNIYPIILDNNINSYNWIVDNIQNYYGEDSCKFFCGSTSIINDLNIYVDGIIHFAAHKSVGESVKDPLEYYNNNIRSLLDILSYINKYRIRNFIFSSSCTVYGDVQSCPIDENYPVTKGLNPYGQTKIICEKIITDFYSANKDLNCVMLRYFNPVGANILVPIGEKPKKTPESLVSRLLNYASNKDSFVVHGNDYNTFDGSPVRDYVDVNDLSLCHTECFKKMRDCGGLFKIYNVGSGGGTTVLELIRTFEKVSGLKLQINVGPRRYGDAEEVYADVSKIKNEMNISCDTPLETSLTNCWIWQQYLNKKGY